jgi:hypothetical protein
LTEKFDEIKGVMRSRKSKDRQYNYQKKKKKQTTTYKTLHTQLKIEQHNLEKLSHVVRTIDFD